MTFTVGHWGDLKNGNPFPYNTAFDFGSYMVFVVPAPPPTLWTHPIVNRHCKYSSHTPLPHILNTIRLLYPIIKCSWPLSPHCELASILLHFKMELFKPVFNKRISKMSAAKGLHLVKTFQNVILIVCGVGHTIAASIVLRDTTYTT